MTDLTKGNSKGQETPAQELSVTDKGYRSSPPKCGTCGTHIEKTAEYVKDGLGAYLPTHPECVAEYEENQRWLRLTPEQRQGKLEDALQEVKNKEQQLEHLCDLEKALTPQELVSIKRVGTLLAYTLVPFLCTYTVFASLRESEKKDHILGESRMSDIAGTLLAATESLYTYSGYGLLLQASYSDLDSEQFFGTVTYFALKPIILTLLRFISPVLNSYSIKNAETQIQKSREKAENIQHKIAEFEETENEAEPAKIEKQSEWVKE